MRGHHRARTRERNARRAGDFIATGPPPHSRPALTGRARGQRSVNDALEKPGVNAGQHRSQRVGQRAAKTAWSTGCDKANTSGGQGVSLVTPDD
jgi:hypothetical protein